MSHPIVSPWVSLQCDVGIWPVPYLEPISLFLPHGSACRSVWSQKALLAKDAVCVRPLVSKRADRGFLTGLCCALLPLNIRRPQAASLLDGLKGESCLPKCCWGNFCLTGQMHMEVHLASQRGCSGKGIERKKPYGSP